MLWVHAVGSTGVNWWHFHRLTALSRSKNELERVAGDRPHVLDNPHALRIRRAADRSKAVGAAIGRAFVSNPEGAAASAVARALDGAARVRAHGNGLCVDILYGDQHQDAESQDQAR